MVIYDGKEYSGNIICNEDARRVTVILYTTDSVDDIAQAACHVSSVTETDENGHSKSYTVAAPVSTSVVSTHVYAVEFTTELTDMQKLARVVQEQSDTIDSLLVMVLEE